MNNMDKMIIDNIVDKSVRDSVLDTVRISVHHYTYNEIKEMNNE